MVTDMLLAITRAAPIAVARALSLAMMTGKDKCFKAGGILNN